ncbi:hypothetical protein SPYCW_3003 [Sphingopyxis sp. EG6]|nr:hypothetical protein SPYCW_3003 [Sphingopyxis sp. EG6]
MGETRSKGKGGPAKRAAADLSNPCGVIGGGWGERRESGARAIRAYRHRLRKGGLTQRRKGAKGIVAVFNAR